MSERATNRRLAAILAADVVADDQLWNFGSTEHRPNRDDPNLWTYGDHETLTLEQRKIPLRFPGGEYLVIWDPSLQDDVTIVIGDLRRTWPLFLREFRDGDIRLSGMASGIPQVLDNGYWFEFLIAERCSISLLGGGVLLASGHGNLTKTRAATRRSAGGPPDTPRTPARRRAKAYRPPD